LDDRLAALDFATTVVRHSEPLHDLNVRNADSMTPAVHPEPEVLYPVDLRARERVGRTIGSRSTGRRWTIR
jgi:hypothetical protein